MTTLCQHENISREEQREEVGLRLKRNARVAVGAILAFLLATP